HPECNMAMFSWCGGVSGNTEEGINIYLNKMVELETDYPERIFIYMTGHLDGGGPTGNLYLRNNQIRDFCNANDKILFDFADIESYDPDGNYFPDGSDGCEWCYDWCLTHECPSCDCAHSQCFNCYLKGKAWWWMMATILGWNSQPDVSIDMIPDSPPVTVTQGGSFTFTGILTNNTDQPQVTDVAIFLDVPTIGPYGPLDIFHNIYLGPNDSLIYTGVTQEVPGYAILGDYDYRAYCGDYPNNPIDSASFPFTVTTALENNIAGDWDLTSWFEPANSVLPEKSRLIGNYPNPFNATTTISFELADESNAALTIYDILGRKVTTISKGYFLAGVHNIPWDASEYSSGIYFYGLTTAGQTTTGRMTLLK
ncbi:MAG: T9SS type A sorting domain-containing protein, partial [candidate division Zixibacteria bacterium]|nr:T9SS type A sorting domain-containing protein [candidate division Zixibacteria bacterium]